MSQRKELSVRRKIGFAAAVLLMLGLAVEGYARLRERPTPGEDGGLLQPDPALGFALRPGFHGKSHSGFGLWIEAEVNQRGMRDGALVSPKPPGTFRIACVGGSTTFGFGATTNAAAWPNALERELGEGWDVLNLGVHSWTLATSLANLRERLADVELDAIVVLHGHNDLYASFEPGYLAAARGEPYVPPRASALDRLLEQSAAVRRYRRRALRWKRRHTKADALSPEGLAAYRANLEALVRLAEERGAALLLCTFPHRFPPTVAEAQALAPDRYEDFLRHSVHTYPVFLEGLARYDAAVRAVAVEHDLPLCDLAKTLPTDPELYVDFVHRSDAGHEALARQVKAAILRAGWR